MHRNPVPLVGGAAIYLAMVLIIILATPYAVETLPLIIACGMMLGAVAATDNAWDRARRNNPEAVEAFGHGATVEFPQTQVDWLAGVLAANPACEVVLLTMNAVTGAGEATRPELAAYYQNYRDVAQARGLRLVDCYPVWDIMKRERPAELGWKQKGGGKNETLQR